jgi:YfiH family protein
MMFMSEPQPSGGFEWTQAAGGRALRCPPLLAWAPHFFTSRDLTLGDDAEWAAVATAVDVDLSSLRMIRQVHGAGVAVVRQGATSDWSSPEADVIVSDDPETAIVVRVADCAPILFADTRLGVIAAAHAGWRGAAQAAAPAAVSALSDHFGSQPRDLIAAIGPCLGVCCGEVGPEVVEAFTNAGHAATDIDRWFRPGFGDRSYLDLAGANVDQLAAAGVPRDRIYDTGLCTKSHRRLFHSYRADGRGAGRMAAVIRRKK